MQLVFYILWQSSCRHKKAVIPKRTLVFHAHFSQYLILLFSQTQIRLSIFLFNQMSETFTYENYFLSLAYFLLCIRSSLGDRILPLSICSQILGTYRHITSYIILVNMDQNLMDHDPLSRFCHRQHIFQCIYLELFLSFAVKVNCHTMGRHCLLLCILCL